MIAHFSGSSYSYCLLTSTSSSIGPGPLKHAMFAVWCIVDVVAVVVIKTKLRGPCSLALCNRDFLHPDQNKTTCSPSAINERREEWFDLCLCFSTIDVWFVRYSCVKCCRKCNKLRCHVSMCGFHRISGADLLSKLEHNTLSYLRHLVYHLQYDI